MRPSFAAPAPPRQPARRDLGAARGPGISHDAGRAYFEGRDPFFDRWPRDPSLPLSIISYRPANQRHWRPSPDSGARAMDSQRFAAGGTRKAAVSRPVLKHGSPIRATPRPKAGPDSWIQGGRCRSKLVAGQPEGAGNPLNLGPPGLGGVMRLWAMASRRQRQAC